jgi:hypothetical protein
MAKDLRRSRALAIRNCPEWMVREAYLNYLMTNAGYATMNKGKDDDEQNMG